MTQPTTDTRAVVHALTLLTTQVRRVADTLTTPVVTSTDDTPTAGTERPFVIVHGDYDMSPEAREALGALVDVAVRQATETPERPAADEDALRTARRDSLLVLLSRAARGTLIPEEGDLLRQHVEDEIREGEQQRALHAQAEDLLRIAHETSNRSEAERANAVVRAERYEAERDAARNRLTFMEENTLPELYRRTNADRETVGRWRKRAELAEAAIERVRDAAHLNRRGLLNAMELHAVIGPATTPDGTEQPTAGDDPEALRAKVDEATDTLRRVRTVVKVWSQRTLPHSEAHRLYVEVCDALAGPRPDPEQPTEA